MIAAPVPRPDPAPNSGHAPITYVDTRYVTPAVDKHTGELIPGYAFRCLLPARWHGHLNVNGKRVCVLFKRH